MGYYDTVKMKGKIKKCSWVVIYKMYYSVKTNQQQLAEQQLEYMIPFVFEKVYAHMILYRNF